MISRKAIATNQLPSSSCISRAASRCKRWEEIRSEYAATTMLLHQMNSSTMEERLEYGLNAVPKLLINDFELTSNNCQLYNNPITTYVKCAAEMEKYMWSLVTW
jgi:hypothetical protein